MTRSIRKRQKSLRKKSVNKIGHDQSPSWRPKQTRSMADLMESKLEAWIKRTHID